MDQATYDRLYQEALARITPKQSGISDAPLSDADIFKMYGITPPETGYVAGVGRSLGRGVGGALEQIGAWGQSDYGTATDPLTRAGKVVAGLGTSLKNSIDAPIVDPESQKARVFEAAEAFPGSMTYALPTYVGGALGGIGATALGAPTGPGAIFTGLAGRAAGAAAAASLMTPLMKRASTVEAYNLIKEKRPDLPEEEVRRLADNYGWMEALPEAGGNVAEAMIFGSTPLGAGAKTGVDLLKGMFGHTIRRAPINIAKTMPIEMGTEAITGYTQAELLRDAGVTPEADPVKEMLRGANVAFYMSGGQGTIGTGIQAGNQKLKEISLFNTTAGQGGTFQQSAYNELYEATKQNLGEDIAENVAKNYDLAVLSGTKLAFDESLFMDPFEATVNDDKTEADLLNGESATIYDAETIAKHGYSRLNQVLGDVSMGEQQDLTLLGSKGKSIKFGIDPRIAQGAMELEGSKFEKLLNTGSITIPQTAIGKQEIAGIKQAAKANGLTLDITLVPSSQGVPAARIKIKTQPQGIQSTERQYELPFEQKQPLLPGIQAQTQTALPLQDEIQEPYQPEFPFGEEYQPELELPYTRSVTLEAAPAAENEMMQPALAPIEDVIQTEEYKPESQLNLPPVGTEAVDTILPLQDEVVEGYQDSTKKQITPQEIANFDDDTLLQYRDPATLDTLEQETAQNVTNEFNRRWVTNAKGKSFRLRIPKGKTSPLLGGNLVAIVGPKGKSGTITLPASQIETLKALFPEVVSEPALTTTTSNENVSNESVPTNTSRRVDDFDTGRGGKTNLTQNEITQKEEAIKADLQTLVDDVATFEDVQLDISDLDNLDNEQNQEALKQIDAESAANFNKHVAELKALKEARNKFAKPDNSYSIAEATDETPILLTDEVVDEPTSKASNASIIKEFNHNEKMNIRPAVPSKAQRELAEIIFKIFGVRVIYVRGLSSRFNGVALRKHGVILVKAEANLTDKNARNNARWLVGHELLHLLETKDPRAFAHLVKLVTPYLKNQGVHKQGLNNRVKAQNLKILKALAAQGYTREQILEMQKSEQIKSYDLYTEENASKELLSDVFGDLLMQKDFWKQLTSENKNLAAQLLETIHDIIDKVKAMFAGKQMTAAASQFITDMESIKQVASQFVRYHKRKAVSATPAGIKSKHSPLAVSPAQLDPIRWAFRSKDVIPFQKLVDRILPKIKNPAQREVLKLLKRAGVDSNVFIKSKDDPDVKKIWGTNIPIAYYTDEDNSITLIHEYSGKSIIQVLVHESAHAGIKRAFIDNPRLRKQVDELRLYVLDVLSKTDKPPTLSKVTLSSDNNAPFEFYHAPHFGLTDVDEFIAETFANPEFRKFLAEIPYEGKYRNTGWRQQLQSVWDHLVDLYNAILGGDVHTRSALKEALDLGIEAIDIGRGKQLRKDIKNEITQQSGYSFAEEPAKPYNDIVKRERISAISYSLAETPFVQEAKEQAKYIYEQYKKDDNLIEGLVKSFERVMPNAEAFLTNLLRTPLSIAKKLDAMGIVAGKTLLKMVQNSEVKTENYHANLSNFLSGREFADGLNKPSFKDLNTMFSQMNTDQQHGFIRLNVYGDMVGKVLDSYTEAKAIEHNGEKIFKNLDEKTFKAYQAMQRFGKGIYKQVYQQTMQQALSRYKKAVAAKLAQMLADESFEKVDIEFRNKAYAIIAEKESGIAKEEVDEVLMSILEARSVLQRMRDSFNARKGYMPRIRKPGPYKLNIFTEAEDKKGKPIKVKVYSDYFNSEIHRQYAIMDYEKDPETFLGLVYNKDNEYEIKLEYVPAKTGLSYSSGLGTLASDSLLTETLERAKRVGSLTESEIGKVHRAMEKHAAEVMLAMSGAGKHKIQRLSEYVAGFEENPIKAYEMYINNLALSLAKSEYVTDQLKLYNTLRKQDPKLSEYAIEYIHETTKARTLADKYSANIRYMATLYYMGGNISSAIINLSQNLVLGVPTLVKLIETNTKVQGKYSSIQAMKTIWKYYKLVAPQIAKESTANITKSAIEMFQDNAALAPPIMEKGLQNLLTRYRKSGLNFDTQSMMAAGVNEDHFGERATSELKNFFDKFMIPFKSVEVANRESAFLAAIAEVSKTRQYDLNKLTEAQEQELYELGREFVNDVHFMGQGNLPMFAQKSALMRTSLAMQSYGINFFNLFYNAMTENNKVQWRYVANVIGMMGLLGGAVGAIPGSDELNKLLRRMLGYDPKLAAKTKLKEVTNETFTNVVMHGLPSLVNIDISSNINLRIPVISSFVSGSDLGISAAGAPGSMLERFMKAMDYVSEGQFAKGIATGSFIVLGRAMDSYLQATRGYTSRSGGDVFVGKEPAKLGTGAALLKGVVGFRTSEDSSLSTARETAYALRKDIGKKRQVAVNQARLGNTDYVEAFNKKWENTPQWQDITNKIKYSDIKKPRVNKKESSFLDKYTDNDE